VEIIKDGEQHGIEKSAINVIDGNGLSPQNRVTTDALVKVLQYAKTRPYNSFYNALPAYKYEMKSGTISRKSFAGYHTSMNEQHTHLLLSLIILMKPGKYCSENI
jgi:D-alanyl-D-alanine carboxypeptidase/D-alanyl-D-alanine-endopeptidase (penicillin-binding protein 4)